MKFDKNDFIVNKVGLREKWLNHVSYEVDAEPRKLNRKIRRPTILPKIEDNNRSLARKQSNLNISP